MQRLAFERDQYKTAYNEWMDKMAWARTWDSPAELGKHIAEVVKGRFDAMIADNERLTKECARLAEDNRGLLEDFEGAL